MAYGLYWELTMVSSENWSLSPLRTGYGLPAVVADTRSQVLHSPVGHSWTWSKYVLTECRGGQNSVLIECRSGQNSVLIECRSGQISVLIECRGRDKICVQRWRQNVCWLNA